MPAALPAPAALRAAARDLRRLRVLVSLRAGLSCAVIDRLLGALDRLDRFDAVESGRERLVAKLNAMAQRTTATRSTAAGGGVKGTPRPPLTRRTALISRKNPPQRQAQDLTPLDKT